MALDVKGGKAAASVTIFQPSGDLTFTRAFSHCGMPTFLPSEPPTYTALSSTAIAVPGGAAMFTRTPVALSYRQSPSATLTKYRKVPSTARLSAYRSGSSLVATDALPPSRP